MGCQSYRASSTHNQLTETQLAGSAASFFKKSKKRERGAPKLPSQPSDSRSADVSAVRCFPGSAGSLIWNNHFINVDVKNIKSTYRFSYLLFILL